MKRFNYLISSVSIKGLRSVKGIVYDSKITKFYYNTHNDFSISMSDENISINNSSINNNRKNNHEKRLFDNSAVRQHNLNAFNSIGIPLETLIDSNSFFRRV